MGKSIQNISNEKKEIIYAVHRLMEYGGGIEEEEAAEVFGEKTVSSLFTAISTGFVVNNSGRIYIRPSLMITLAREGVLN